MTKKKWKKQMAKIQRNMDELEQTFANHLVTDHGYRELAPEPDGIRVLLEPEPVEPINLETVKETS